MLHFEVEKKTESTLETKGSLGSDTADRDAARVCGQSMVVRRRAMRGKAAASQWLDVTLLLRVSIGMLNNAAKFCRGTSMLGWGTGWLRSMAHAGNALNILAATASFARSIISSTMELVSNSVYLPTRMQ